MTRLVDLSDPVNVVWLDTVDSTNSVAERLVDAWLAAEDDRLAETVVVARRQTAGRGRGARTWESPAGGLYATWLAWLPVGKLAAVPRAVAVCVAAAVEPLVPGIRVGLKWPNDLQVAGRKLGGVLCASRSDAESAWVVAGFGVNVGSSPSLGEGEREEAVSLRSLGLAGDADDAIWTIVSRFVRDVHAAVDDREATRSRWIARSVHRPGDAVRVRVDGGHVEGRLVGFGRDGELELEVAGQVRRFAAGDVVTRDKPGG